MLNDEISNFWHGCRRSGLWRQRFRRYGAACTHLVAASALCVHPSNAKALQRRQAAADAEGELIVLADLSGVCKLCLTTRQVSEGNIQTSFSATLLEKILPGGHIFSSLGHDKESLTAAQAFQYLLSSRRARITACHNDEWRRHAVGANDPSQGLMKGSRIASR